VIINPANMAYAQGTIGDIISNMTQGNMTQGNMTQGNMTQGNMTTVIDVDTLTKNIKERHPILTQMSAADEDQDLMVKIKGMDPKEAAKTAIALNMLRLLQQYKQLDVE
jgi:hypothetical protein